MDKKELIDYLLKANEWQKFDCKRVLKKPAKVLETIVAFANTDGGMLVLGLEDPVKAKNRERLIGINEKKENVSEVLRLINSEISPAFGGIRHFMIPILNREGEEDELCLIVIDKSNDIHSLRSGDTFIRVGDKTIKIGANEITRLKYEKGSVKYEDELSGIKDLDVLDNDLLLLYRKEVGSASEDLWQFLKDNALAAGRNGHRQLTKAGILLFAKNPAVILKKKCSIKISHYFGTKQVYTGEPNFVRRPFSIEGPLLKQIEQAVVYFEEVVRSSPPKLKGPTFAPSFLIPSWVFQEAITNAVIHRNYAIEDDIQVRFFADRVEVESPGTYPGHITVANIRSERFSRNPIILRTLNRFAKAPNLDTGEGVDRMFKVMHESNLYEPLYFPPKIRPYSVLVVLLNMQRIEYWDIVSNFLDKNGKISNKEARKITGIQDTIKMSRMLKEWKEKGLLEKKGEGTSGVYYIKTGYDVPTDFFA